MKIAKWFVRSILGAEFNGKIVLDFSLDGGNSATKFNEIIEISK